MCYYSYSDKEKDTVIRWKYSDMSNRKSTKRKNNKRRITKAQRQRQVRQRMKLGLYLLTVLFVFLVIVKIIIPSLFPEKYYELKGEDIDASKPDIDVELLTVNPYSRPGKETGKINGIVVHYTANPGATAMANRNYFEGLKDTHETKTSSNFIVGLDGEIIQCVPTWEIAYASNERNGDTVSIECCHPDESGKFNEETYRSTVQLCAWLCLKFNLSEKDVIRHYDVTGKNCPKYFVENEEAWKQFRQDIKSALEKAQK